MKHATILVLGVIAVTGCNPTMAPPLRTTHYGAPARMSHHRVEVSGAGTIYGSGGAWGGLRVAPGLRVELGTDLRFVDEENWALGGAGLRYTVDGRNAKLWGVAFDIELGAALGVGGVLDENNADGRSWNHRLAGGGYLGLGVGAYMTRHFALFLRTRGQVSGARGIPTTLWGSALGGFEIAWGHVAWYVAGGAAGYRNDADAAFGATAETGLSLRLF